MRESEEALKRANITHLRFGTNQWTLRVATQNCTNFLKEKAELIHHNSKNEKTKTSRSQKTDLIPSKRVTPEDKPYPSNFPHLQRDSWSNGTKKIYHAYICIVCANTMCRYKYITKEVQHKVQAKSKSSAKHNYTRKT